MTFDENADTSARHVRDVPDFSESVPTPTERAPTTCTRPSGW